MLRGQSSMDSVVRDGRTPVRVARGAAGYRSHQGAAGVRGGLRRRPVQRDAPPPEPDAGDAPQQPEIGHERPAARYSDMSGRRSTFQAMPHSSPIVAASAMPTTTAQAAAFR